MTEQTRPTASDIAVPEALYMRFGDPVGVFATIDGVILSREHLERPVKVSHLIKATKLVETADPRINHPLEAIAEGGIGVAPLLFLDAASIHAEASAEPNKGIGCTKERTEQAHSRLGCYIPAWVMMNEFDIPVAACGVTGQLLPGELSDKGSLFPQCVDSVIGAEVQSMSIHPKPLDYITEIEEMLNDPAALERPLDAQVLPGPEGYATDAPVSDGQKAKGITAWRRLENPADPEQAIMLPIYDTDAIPYETEDLRAAEAAKVPRAGDEGLPENYIDYDGITYPIAVAMTVLRDSPSLIGPPGVGKTALYRNMAYLMGLPYTRISITPSTEVDELAGHMEYHPEKGTEFRYGRLAAAWTQPGVICLDEPNSARPDVWFLLRPLLDSEKQLAIDTNEGELLTRHESSYLGLAMNPSWDYRNSGTNPLADADVSRLFHVQVGLPPENIEAEIIRTHCASVGFDISDQQLRVMRRIATDLRDTAAGGSLMFSWGTRSQLKVAKLLPYLTIEQAYQAALGASLEPEQEDLFLSTVRGHL